MDHDEPQSDLSRALEKADRRTRIDRLKQDCRLKACFFSSIRSGTS